MSLFSLKLSRLCSACVALFLIGLNAPRFVDSATVTCLKMPWRIKPSWHDIVDAVPLPMPAGPIVATIGSAANNVSVTLIECQTACYRAEATLTPLGSGALGPSNTLWIAFGCLSDGDDEQLVQRVVQEAATHAAVTTTGGNAAAAVPAAAVQFNTTCGNQWPFIDLPARLNSDSPAQITIQNFQQTNATFHLAMHVCDKASLFNATANSTDPPKCYRDEFAFCVAPYCASQPQAAIHSVPEKQSQACKLGSAAAGVSLLPGTSAKVGETNLSFPTAAVGIPPVRFVNGACLIYEPNLNSATAAYDFNITCMVSDSSSGSIADFITSTSAKILEQKEYSQKSSLIFHTLVQPTSTTSPTLSVEATTHPTAVPASSPASKRR